jgi:hypothetical protein
LIRKAHPESRASFEVATKAEHKKSHSRK